MRGQPIAESRPRTTEPTTDREVQTLYDDVSHDLELLLGRFKLKPSVTRASDVLVGLGEFLLVEAEHRMGLLSFRKYGKVSRTW